MFHVCSWTVFRFKFYNPLNKEQEEEEEEEENMLNTVRLIG